MSGRRNNPRWGSYRPFGPGYNQGYGSYPDTRVETTYPHYIYSARPGSIYAVNPAYGTNYHNGEPYTNWSDYRGGGSRAYPCFGLGSRSSFRERSGLASDLQRAALSRFSNLRRPSRVETSYTNPSAGYGDYQPQLLCLCCGRRPASPNIPGGEALCEACFHESQVAAMRFGL